MKRRAYKGVPTVIHPVNSQQWSVTVYQLPLTAHGLLQERLEIWQSPISHLYTFVSVPVMTGSRPQIQGVSILAVTSSVFPSAESSPSTSTVTSIPLTSMVDSADNSRGRRGDFSPSAQITPAGTTAVPHTCPAFTFNPVPRVASPATRFALSVKSRVRVVWLPKSPVTVPVKTPSNGPAAGLGGAANAVTLNKTNAAKVINKPVVNFLMSLYLHRR